MPLTFTDVTAASGVGTVVIGNLRCRHTVATFDTSYPTGGEPLTPATLGFEQIYYLTADAPAGYVISYDYTNQTLLVYRINIAATAGADIVAGADNQIVQNAALTGLEVSGAGVAYQAALGEVTAATDLSTDLAAVRLMVIGV